MNNSHSQSKDSKYFQTSKHKADPFFRSTKVETCSHVLVKNGQSLAVPFKIQNEKGHPMLHYTFAESKSSEAKSVYRKDFTPKPFMHAGMGKKPLVKYNPDSYRNRLPVGGVIMPLKNKSVIEIGDRGLVNRKQWVSTSNDTFRQPVVLPISNPGIISDMTKRAHKKIESIF